jgi:hypothetical protein
MKPWELFITIIAMLGGAGVVAGGVAAFVAKFFSDRMLEKQKAELGQETERLKGELVKDTETHKLKLKKQELLFAKELEAATEFFDLHRQIESKYRHPDMEWDEALTDVVEDFGSTEDRLQKFIAKYGPVLSDANRKGLELCMSMASNDRFTAAGVGHGDMKTAKESAEELLETLKQIEDLFVKELRA